MQIIEYLMVKKNESVVEAFFTVPVLKKKIYKSVKNLENQTVISTFLI